MSLARDTGHRGSIPGRSRPFRDGWQPYLNVLVSHVLVLVLASLVLVLVLVLGLCPSPCMFSPC